MTKISALIKGYLRNSANNLRDRVKAVTPCPMPAHQLHKLCTRPEDRELMRKATELHSPFSTYYLGYQTAYVVTSKVRVKFNLTYNWDHRPEHLPIQMFDTSLAPPELIKPFNDWLENHIEFISLWQAIHPIIDYFEMKGYTLEQLRYMLPGTLILVTSYEPLHMYAERLRKFKAPAMIPSLPDNIFNLIPRAKEALTIAALMPKVQKGQDDKSGVNVEEITER